jgi:hypothetical protein
MSMSTLKQAVMHPGQSAAGELLKPGRASLTGWYGDPLTAASARALLVRTQRRLQSRLCRGGRCFSLHVLSMICHHWLQSACELDYRQLVTLACDDGERALVELVYGQLLISVKRLPARQHLARGFMLAAPQLDTADYFFLLRRHELLEHLPLSEMPVAAQDLRLLLQQAAVIRRLRVGERRAVRDSHHDTLG